MKKSFVYATILLIGTLIALAQNVFAEETENCTQPEPYTYITIYPDNYEPLENKKIVYLTFDDGPTKHTPEILSILDTHGIKATFFVVGNREHPHYMKEIVERGHAIGLHSYNHNFEQIYSSKEAFFRDFQKIDDIVYEQTGVRSKIMRFPGGSSIKRGSAKWIMSELKKELSERGYQFFDWNCDSRDKMGAKTATEAFSKVKSASKDADDIIIVLMHDTEKITIQYLPDVIEHFKALGYEFLPLCPDSPTIHHTW